MGWIFCGYWMACEDIGINGVSHFISLISFCA